MKTLRTHLVIAVTMGLLAVAAIVTPQAAQATILKTYTYTGNTFTTATGLFVGSSVTGSFTIDCGRLVALAIAHLSRVTLPPLSRPSRFRRAP